MAESKAERRQRLALNTLGQGAMAQRRTEVALRRAVGQARNEGCTWAAIAHALGRPTTTVYRVYGGDA